MPHHTPLIATIVAGLVVAFVLGALAQRLKASPLIGYLLAGIVVGPFTPGYVADQSMASELAELGVILLMFGVGLHFSIKDLMSARKVAIPGALAQMTVATLLGIGMAYLMGWTLAAGVVFGLALSVASTVVLLRALQERRAVQTERGRIAVAWLIVEDLAMVLALVLLPALAGAVSQTAPQASVMDAWIVPFGVTLLKVGAFAAFMLIVGRRVIPWTLHYVAHTGSRELFRLAVLAIALGVAFGAALLFDVSFALGAFFAGMILAESELSHRAAEETLPLRDAFAVLFFVSVGMLFNPFVLISHPWAILGVLGIILLGKSLAALAIMKLFKRNAETSFTVAASLAQIGEFSFILAGLGVGLGLLPKLGSDLILGGAILSIMLNPLMFVVARWATRLVDARHAPPTAANDPPPVVLVDHTVLVGFGRVGQVVAAGLSRRSAPFVVIDAQPEGVAAARAAGFEAIEGNCANHALLAATNIARARRLVVAIPDPAEAGAIVERARTVNPALEIIARAHTDAAAAHLTAHGADTVIMGEREIANGMLSFMIRTAKPADPPASSTAAAIVPPSLTGAERLILDDAERAVLDGFRARRIGAGEAVSIETISADAEGMGFSPDRLRTAFASLAEKACLNLLGDGRVRLTQAGLVQAVSSRPLA
jgi:CPA2 family monovalent cation:H+ antiporter-2